MRKALIVALMAMAAAVPAEAQKAKPAAKPAAKTSAPAAPSLKEQGEKAVRAYDRPAIAAVISKWKAAVKGEEPQALRSLRNRSVAVSNMLGRVENIVVVDTLVVPRDTFFEHYRLSPDAGTLSGTADLPEFTLPSRTEMFYTQSDSSGISRIMHADILDDGSLSAEEPVDLSLPSDVSASFPFMAADGTTLYFAAKTDDENSLGGYDLYMTRRNADGSFLEPTNLGMPYNSPYNDYMFVLDEGTGLGWWASDRGVAPDSVRLFVFVPNESRINYDPETENIEALALVKDPAATWPADFNRQAVLDRLQNLPRHSAVRTDSDEFPPVSLGNGVVYTRPEQFTASGAGALVDAYIEACANLREAERRLDYLRSVYAAGDHSVAADIRTAETAIPALRRALVTRRNALIRSASRP